MLKLVDYQKNIINRTFSKLKEGFNATLIVSPTGSGKTVTFTAMIKFLNQHNKSAYVLSPRSNITSSICKTFKMFGIDYGVVAPNFTTMNKITQVCSAYSVNRIFKLPAPDFLFIDEAHHSTAGSWVKIIEHFLMLNPKMRIVGVTASPIRGDGQGLGISGGGIYDCMVQGPTVAELIERGKTHGFGLADYSYYRAQQSVDLSQIGIRGNDFAPEPTADLMMKREIVGSAVDLYIEKSKYLPGLGFCVNIAHAEKQAEEFRARGVKCKAIHGGLSNREIERLIKNLSDGSVHALMSVALISEGTDIPDANTMIDLAPTWSLGLCMQRRGRVLRYKKNKNAIFLDHVNNWARHQYPCSDHEWDLNATKIQRKKGKTEEVETVVKSKQCNECGKVHTPQPTCPRCGFVYSSKQDLKEVDGLLVEVDKDEIKRLRLQQRQTQGRASSLDELIEHAKATGKSVAWAKHVFNAREKKKRGF